MTQPENPGSQKLPELIYHGTIESKAKRALNVGLKPKRKKGTKWDVRGHDELLYLTTCYPGFFAFESTKTQKGRWGFVEIDFTKVNKLRLAPNEAFIVQAYPEIFERFGIANEQDRKAFVVSALPQFAKHWRDSLQYMGTIYHKGPISPVAIKRVALFDPSSNPEMGLLVGDLMISVPTHHMLAPRYELLVKWIFGDSIDDDLLLDIIPDKSDIPKAVSEVYPEFSKLGDSPDCKKEVLTNILSKRDGIEILQPAPSGT